MFDAHAFLLLNNAIALFAGLLMLLGEHRAAFDRR